jgi:hypothetical protein
MDDLSILSLKGVTIGHVVFVEDRYEKVGHGVGGLNRAGIVGGKSS